MASAHIKFSSNWNAKLGSPIFTTLRKFTQEKLDYYRAQKDQLFDVILDGTKINEATLLQVRRVEMDDLLDALLMLDTGLPSRQEALKLFASFGIQPFDYAILLIFKGEHRG